MHHSLRHRILCGLAVLSLVPFAAPASPMAAPPEDPTAACSVSAAAMAHHAAALQATHATATTAAPAPAGDPGPACEAGPCSMPLTTCLGAGGCVSATPLAAGARAASSANVRDAPARPVERRLPSPASRHPTPPPRT